MVGTVQNFGMQQIHANSQGFRSARTVAPVVAAALALLLFGVSGVKARAGSGAKQGQAPQAERAGRETKIKPHWTGRR